jgi:hypothetical protein
MDNLCWLLIVLAAAAYIVGAILAFTHGSLGILAVGYWRGAIGLLLFAMALRLMRGAPAAR